MNTFFNLTEIYLKFSCAIFFTVWKKMQPLTNLRPTVGVRILWYWKFLQKNVKNFYTSIYFVTNCVTLKLIHSIQSMKRTYSHCGFLGNVYFFISLTIVFLINLLVPNIKQLLGSLLKLKNLSGNETGFLSKPKRSRIHCSVTFKIV